MHCSLQSLWASSNATLSGSCHLIEEEKMKCPDGKWLRRKTIPLLFLLLHSANTVIFQTKTLGHTFEKGMWKVLKQYQIKLYLLILLINHLTEKKKEWCRNLDCLRTSGRHISPPSLCEYLNAVTLPQVLTPCAFPLPLSSSFYLQASFYYPAFFSFVFNHVSMLLQFVSPDMLGNL